MWEESDEEFAAATGLLKLGCKESSSPTCLISMAAEASSSITLQAFPGGYDFSAFQFEADDDPYSLQAVVSGAARQCGGFGGNDGFCDLSAMSADFQEQCMEDAVEADECWRSLMQVEQQAKEEVDELITAGDVAEALAFSSSAPELLAVHQFSSYPPLPRLQQQQQQQQQCCCFPGTKQGDHHHQQQQQQLLPFPSAGFDDQELILKDEEMEAEAAYNDGSNPLLLWILKQQEEQQRLEKKLEEMQVLMEEATSRKEAALKLAETKSAEAAMQRLIYVRDSRQRDFEAAFNFALKNNLVIDVDAAAAEDVVDCCDQSDEETLTLPGLSESRESDGEDDEQNTSSAEITNDEQRTTPAEIFPTAAAAVATNRRSRNTHTVDATLVNALRSRKAATYDHASSPLEIMEADVYAVHPARLLLCRKQLLLLQNKVLQRSSSPVKNHTGRLQMEAAGAVAGDQS